MREKIALVALVIVLLLVNWSISGKEKHLSDGRIVYLQMAPVDPRSLMQGDYMALQFQITNEVYAALPKSENRGRWRQDVDAVDGYVVVGLDEQNIGTFRRIHNGQSVADDEVLMRYRVRAGSVKLATNAWFFQEGHAKVYQPARFGQFRVDDKGELLLAAMYNQDLEKIQPPADLQ